MLHQCWWSFQEATVAACKLAHAELKPWYYPLQQRLNGPCFRADIHARVGLFAQMSWLVYILAHCRKHELEPVLRFTSPYYTDPDSKPCWLTSLFIPNPQRLPLADASRCQQAYVASVTNFAQLGLSEAYARSMTLGGAHTLLHEYYVLAPRVIAAVEAVLGHHRGNSRLLGVHYRGTDKATEAPQVSMPRLLATIAAYLDQNPDYSAVFIATDELAFLELAHRALPGVTLFSNPSAQRSTDGQPIHSQTSAGDRLRKAEEALLDCLVLSRCHALIRTASMLSAWASVFNPELPVVLLNQPYASKLWFPDREVLRSARCCLAV